MAQPRIDRRTLLRSLGLAGAAVAASPLVGACAKSDAGLISSDGRAGSVDPAVLTLVSLYGTSGSQAELGQECLDGIRLASDAYGGMVLNKPIEVVSYDTQEAIDDSVRRVRESAEGGARFFLGGLLSSTALATAEEVNKAGGIYMTSGGADELTGSECRQAMFRWPVSTYGAIEETVRPMIEANPSRRRWYTITPDYVFGQALLDNAERVFADTGVEHVGNAMHGLDVTEFSGYITKALAAKPDVLCILSYGTQSTTLLQQAVTFGCKDEMELLLTWSGGLSQFRALGPEMLEGVYAGAQYWHTVDAPGNNAFVDLFRRKHGTNPSYPHACGYIGGKLILDGVKAAGTADPATVVKKLEGLTYEGPTGSETVRGADHQSIKDYYLLQGKAPSAMADDDDFMEILSRGRSAVAVEESGCTLQPFGAAS